MKKTSSKLPIEGFVEDVSTRKAQSGSWAHEYRIKTKTYSHFTDDDGPLLSKGDYVRFVAQMRSLRSSRRKYYAIEAETIELIDPTGGGSSGKGYVYILSNSSMPGLLKVGYTEGAVAERAAALSATTGVPVPFKVEWFLPIQGNAALVESAAHAHLAAGRRGKEFFRVGLEAAKQAVAQAYVSLYPDAAQDTSDVLGSRLEALQQRSQERRLRLEAERARREYEKSPEFKWVCKGKLASEVLSFTEPPPSPPGFWAQLFGEKVQDWLKIQLIGRAGYRADKQYPWRLFLAGSYGGKDLQSSLSSPTDFDRFEQCLSAIRGVLDKLGSIQNPCFDLEIATELLKDPRVPADAVLVHNYGEAYTLPTSYLGGFSLKEQPDATIGGLIGDHLHTVLPESRLVELRRTPREWVPSPRRMLTQAGRGPEEIDELGREPTTLALGNALANPNVLEVVLSLEEFDHPPVRNLEASSETEARYSNDWLQIEILGKGRNESVSDQEWLVQAAGFWQGKEFWRVPDLNPLPISHRLVDCSPTVRQLINEFPVPNRKLELRICGSLLHYTGSNRQFIESEDVMHVPASEWQELRIKNYWHVSLEQLLQDRFKF